MAVYLVVQPDGKETLVDAANTASARNHVARQCLQVSVAKQADLFRVAKAGGEIATAGEVTAEPQAEPPADGEAGKPPAGDEPPADCAPKNKGTK